MLQIDMFDVQLVCGILASAIYPWLSPMMDVGPSCMYLTSTKSCLNQTIFLVQWIVVMYSTSIVENIMIGCFLHFHEMNPTLIGKKIRTLVDHWSLTFPAQYALQNLVKAIILSSKSKMPFKYLSNISENTLFWTSMYTTTPSHVEIINEGHKIHCIAHKCGPYRPQTLECTITKCLVVDFFACLETQPCVLCL